MTTILEVGRAEALFCAPLSATTLTRAEATAAIRDAVRAHHGVRGCAADVAAEFGDHPDLAVARMRWATATVAALFGPPVRDEIVWSSAVAR